MPPALSSNALLALPEFKEALSPKSLVAAGLPSLPDLPPDLYNQARTHTSWYGFPASSFYVGSGRAAITTGPIEGESEGLYGSSAPEVRSEFERFEVSLRPSLATCTLLLGKTYRSLTGHSQFLGDAILSTSLALLIYERYPEASEGTMTVYV